MKSIAAAVFSVVGLFTATIQSPVPLSGEPRHHFKFENEYVRVFDVAVPPGDATLFHTHSNDYVFVMIGATNVKAEVMGAPAVDLNLKDGEVRFTQAPVSHRVTNPGPMPFRNITVEILKTPGSSAGVPPLTNAAGHSAVLENERVRVERLILEPGQSTGTHTHQLMSLGVIVSGSRIELEALGQKPETIEPKAGEFTWFAQKRTHNLKNIGSTRFEAVEIQWK